MNSPNDTVSKDVAAKLAPVTDRPTAAALTHALPPSRRLAHYPEIPLVRCQEPKKRHPEKAASVIVTCERRSAEERGMGERGKYSTLAPCVALVCVCDRDSSRNSPHLFAGISRNLSSSHCITNRDDLKLCLASTVHTPARRCVCSSAVAATERVTTSSAAYIILCGGRQQQGTMPLAPRCGRSTRLHLCRLRSRSRSVTKTTAMLDGDVSRDASRIRGPHTVGHVDCRLRRLGREMYALPRRCLPLA